jgi:Uma2 family endonuclease
MTPEEFFAWENEQPERHEFIDGEIYAMTGGTYAHSRISSNLHVALASRLMHRGCAVHQGDLKVYVDKDFFYPDIIVQCGTSEIEMKTQVDERPILMAEILSGSTERYDMNTKWLSYRRLPSLQTFLLIAQDKLTIQLFRRRSSPPQLGVGLHRPHRPRRRPRALRARPHAPAPRALRGHPRHRPRAARVLTQPQLLRPICPPCAAPCYPGRPCPRSPSPAPG